MTANKNKEKKKITRWLTFIGRTIALVRHLFSRYEQMLGRTALYPTVLRPLWIHCVLLPFKLHSSIFQVESLLIQLKFERWYKIVKYRVSEVGFNVDFVFVPVIFEEEGRYFWVLKYEFIDQIAWTRTLRETVIVLAPTLFFEIIHLRINNFIKYF